MQVGLAALFIPVPRSSLADSLFVSVALPSSTTPSTPLALDAVNADVDVDVVVNDAPVTAAEAFIPRPNDAPTLLYSSSGLSPGHPPTFGNVMEAGRDGTTSSTEGGVLVLVVG